LSFDQAKLTITSTNNDRHDEQVNLSLPLTDVSSSLFSQPAMMSIDMHVCRMMKRIIHLTRMTMNLASDHRRLNLLDLPNEVLLIIVEYLPMIDALYSFVNITERLDQLVLNPTFTRTLNMTCLRLELLFERIYSLDERVLGILCRTVLPRIRHPISRLIVDQFAIDDVFRAREYPELRSLSLMDIDESYALDFFQSKATLNRVSSHHFLVIRWRRPLQASHRTNHQSDHPYERQLRR
jgi:hypothetical protein